MSPVWHDAADRPSTFRTLQNATSSTADIRVTVIRTGLLWLVERGKCLQSVYCRVKSSAFSRVVPSALTDIVVGELERYNIQCVMS
jgi:hypothetical protein